MGWCFGHNEGNKTKQGVYRRDCSSESHAFNFPSHPSLSCLSSCISDEELGMEKENLGIIVWVVVFFLLWSCDCCMYPPHGPMWKLKASAKQVCFSPLLCHGLHNLAEHEQNKSWVQEKSVVGKLPFVNCLQLLTLLLPKPVSDSEFGVCETKKKQLQAHWHCVWLQIQSWWCHSEGKTLTACTAVKGCMVWCLWGTWNVRKALSLCVIPPSESSAVQRGHRYAWLRFPWRFLVPHYHRWILQIGFLCLTFSTFLFCFVWFCFEGRQKDVVFFLIVWGLFLWVWWFGFFFLLVLTSGVWDFFLFGSEGREK